MPIKHWTQSYKEFLEGLLNGTEKDQPFIKDFKEYHTEACVNFVVTLDEAKMKEAEKVGLYKKFKLDTTIGVTNMVLFDAHQRYVCMYVCMETNTTIEL